MLKHMLSWLDHTIFYCC